MSVGCGTRARRCGALFEVLSTIGSTLASFALLFCFPELCDNADKSRRCSELIVLQLFCGSHVGLGFAPGSHLLVGWGLGAL